METKLPTNPIIVAFQGVHGANSEQAIRQHFGDAVETMPCNSFNDIFQAVETKKATYGLQPIENSLAGTVAQAYELLLEYDLRIQAQIPARGWLMSNMYVRIRRRLVNVNGTSLDAASSQ